MDDDQISQHGPKGLNDPADRCATPVHKRHGFCQNDTTGVDRSRSIRGRETPREKGICLVAAGDLPP